MAVLLFLAHNWLNFKTWLLDLKDSIFPINLKENNEFYHWLCFTKLFGNFENEF